MRFEVVRERKTVFSLNLVGFVRFLLNPEKLDSDFL